MARRLAGRSGLAGAVVRRPVLAFCGRGAELDRAGLRRGAVPSKEEKATKGTSRVAGWLPVVVGKRKSTGHTVRTCGRINHEYLCGPVVRVGEGEGIFSPYSEYSEYEAREKESKST